MVTDIGMIVASPEEEDEGCGWNAFCHIGSFGSDVAESAADGVLGMLTESLVNAVQSVLAIINTWWMDVPSTADLESPVIERLHDDMHYLIAGFAIIGFLFGLGKLVFSQDVKQGMITSFSPIVALIVVTGVYMAAIPMLLESGDAFGGWLLERSVGQDADISILAATLGTPAMMNSLGMVLLMALLMLLGSIVNFVFMIFRDVMLLILVAFIPVIAAATGSQTGKQAFTKANGWLIALLLFKPVAAGIYALGLRLFAMDAETETLGEEANEMAMAMIGLLILCLAGLALPALIKFIVPAAATGAAAFSGGAALGAAASVAGGAAVLAGTGGAGAGAGAAAAGRGDQTAAQGVQNVAGGGDSGGGLPGGGDSNPGGQSPGESNAGSAAGGGATPGGESETSTPGGSESPGESSGGESPGGSGPGGESETVRPGGSDASGNETSTGGSGGQESAVAGSTPGGAGQASGGGSENAAGGSASGSSSPAGSTPSGASGAGNAGESNTGSGGGQGNNLAERLSQAAAAQGSNVEQAVDDQNEENR